MSEQPQRAAGKELLLEMGGNGPLVICEDGDLDKAVEATFFGSFLNAGQSCTAGERFLLHEDVKDEYLSKLASAIGQRISLGGRFLMERLTELKTIVIDLS
jgi:acyl-CoA reductase-like NAD-dependent aldehyde dehydrogenase